MILQLILTTSLAPFFFKRVGEFTFSTCDRPQASESFNIQASVQYVHSIQVHVPIARVVKSVGERKQEPADFVHLGSCWTARLALCQPQDFVDARSTAVAGRLHFNHVLFRGRYSSDTDVRLRRGKHPGLNDFDFSARVLWTLRDLWENSSPKPK